MALITKAAGASALLQASLKSLESVSKLTTAAAVSQADTLKKSPRLKKFAVYRWVDRTPNSKSSPSFNWSKTKFPLLYLQIGP